MEEEGSMLPQRYSRSRSPSGISHNSPDRGEARLATVNGIEPPTMVALISGMAETAQKLKVRLQVEVEPLDVQRR